MPYFLHAARSPSRVGGESSLVMAVSWVFVKTMACRPHPVKTARQHWHTAQHAWSRVCARFTISNVAPNRVTSTVANKRSNDASQYDLECCSLARDHYRITRSTLRQGGGEGMLPILDTCAGVGLLSTATKTLGIRSECVIFG